MQKDMPHLTGGNQAVGLTTVKTPLLKVYMCLRGNLTWLWREKLPMAI